MPPACVSITQATETGSVYTLDEIQAIGAVCRDAGLPLHMDGARFANALVSLGEHDAKALVEECGGTVEIDCQFCNERYAFDAADIAQLFAGAGSEAPSQTRH